MARRASKFDQVVDTVAAPQLLRSLILHMYMMRADWLQIASGTPDPARSDAR